MLLTIPVFFIMSASHQDVKLHEDRNAKIFIKRWGELTRQLGRREWPMEYLRICRNRPSKIRLGQLFKAIWLLLAIGSPAGI